MLFAESRGHSEGGKTEGPGFQRPPQGHGDLEVILEVILAAVEQAVRGRQKTERPLCGCSTSRERIK